MNKQKKELRQRQSTRQLMGISQLTQHGIRTAEGELVFYLIKPDNLSVLSEDGIRGRVMALTRLLCTMPQVQMLALDSRESFRRKKDWYRLRLEQEELPAIRELLRQDGIHLDDIQAGTASAREFAIVLCTERSGGEPDENHLRQTEKHIRDLGFQVRMADPQDIKRLLAVYYQQDVTTDHFDDYDGERWVKDEKHIRDLGFQVRMADPQDIKRLLAVYYQQDVTTDHFDDYDGERWVKDHG